GTDRTAIQSKLKNDSIPSMIYYIKPMHLQGAFFKTDSAVADCPVTEKLCKTVLSLPLHPYMSEQDVKFVVEKIKETL
ncbi:MAG: DegT/DnrJ/EryC1/StrS family aminotransferase, partial [Treponema sp.]|uniref:DegT/DnrJ/EryC1/StrS family aminotransferase n=1 Tax=Treponema sp. TaxID=166 RepID=UPI00298E696F